MEQEKPEWLRGLVGSMPCQRCGKPYTLGELTVLSTNGPVAVLRAACTNCGTRMKYRMAFIEGQPEVEAKEPGLTGDDVVDAHDRLQKPVTLKDLFGEVPL